MYFEQNKVRQINNTSKYTVCHINAMENTKGDEEKKGGSEGESLQFYVYCGQGRLL